MSTSAKRQFGGVLAANVGIAALNFLTGTLSARLLGPAGRGELAVIQLVPNMLGWVVLLGVPNGIAFYVAKLARRRREIFATGLAQCAVLSLAGMAIGAVVLQFVLDDSRAHLRTAAYVYLAFVLLQGTQLPGFMALWGMQRFRVWNLLRVAPAVLWLVTLGGLALLGQVRAVPAALTYLGLYGLVTPAVILAFALATEGRFRLRPRLGRRLVKFGLPTALANVPTVLNQRLDQALMAAFLPSATLGRYAVSVAWSAALSPVTSAIASVLFPRLAAARGEDAAADFGRGVRLTVIAATASTAALAAATPLAIPLLFGEPYREAVPAAVVLVLAAGVSALNAVLEESLRGLGATRWPLYGQLAGLPVTVVLLVALLGPLGLMGAALASLAAYATTSVVLVVGACRTTGARPGQLMVPTGADWRPVVAAIKGLLGRRPA